MKFAIIMAGVVGAFVIALGAKTQEDTSTAPPPPKPYNEAMYDVYSALLQEREPQQPEGVLIRIETLSFKDPSPYEPHGSQRWLGIDPKEERFKPAVDSAIADYLKRNTDVLELQKKFNLSHYDLLTKDEEKGFQFGAHSLCQKYSGYERWVELSAVGFNQDQTVAVVHFIDWGGHPCNFHSLISATGKDRMLQKRDGKWHLLPSRIFSDWILDN